jgi:Rnl2 family RNA ligase
MDNIGYAGYTKIPESSNEWSHTPSKKINKWYVTEKVHGSCFCFVYTTKDDSIQYAKRKTLLDDKDNFFGYEEILPETIPKIKKIAEAIKNKYNSVDTIYVYGELFGGYYPEISSTNKSIQNGIYYSPNIHFMAFDISIKCDQKEEKYIDYEESLSFFNYAKILHAEPLETFTSYGKAIDYKLGFNTTIPKKFNLPEIKNNKAEGIVIKSNRERFITKKKIPEFSETKYSENENYQNDENSIESYKKHAAKYITKNRLNNAISKVGPFDENKDEILETFVDDILYELNAFHIIELREWLLKHVSSTKIE